VGATRAVDKQDVALVLRPAPAEEGDVVV